MPNKENLLNAFSEFLDGIQADVDLDAVDERVMECLVGVGFDPNSDLVSFSDLDEFARADDLDDYVQSDDLGDAISRELDYALEDYVRDCDLDEKVSDAVRDALDDAIEDADLVHTYDFDEKVSDYLCECDLVHGEDLEERMDDLGYGAWVDTTAQFMAEFRQRLVNLEMREVLMDLAEVCNG